MRILAAIAGVAALGLAGLAHGQGMPPAPPSVFKQPVLDLGAVNMMPDIAYSRLPGYRPLKLDLYRPKQQTGPLPVVIWIHGGGWRGGDQRGAAFAGTDMPAMLGEIAARGYVAAAVSYRMAGEARFPAQGQDLRAAIRFLKANAAQYGIDPSKVILWGGSAGGYMAAQAGVSCGDSSFDAPPAQGPAGAAPPAPPAAGSECVQGVIAFYPITDLPELAKRDAPGTANSPEAQFLGCAVSACPANQIALASVISRIDAKDPPFLIMHGDADTTVPIAQSRLLEASLKAKGVPAELVVVPGQTHVFPTLDPAKRKELLDRVNAFLDKQTGKKR
jgi:acetyl esterase/lipase